MRLPSIPMILNSTNTQKVFACLVKEPGREFLASEIQQATGISKAGVYRSLEELVQENLIKKNSKGRVLFYSPQSQDSIVKQYKVLNTVTELRKCVQQLKSSSRRIVLFGSAARGEDNKKSDIDLFILSKEPKITEKIISRVKFVKKIQVIIKTSSQLTEFELKNKEFLNEINSGIVLWEEGDER